MQNLCVTVCICSIIFAWAKRGGTEVSSVLIIRVWKKGKFANFDIFAHKLHNVVKIFYDGAFLSYFLTEFVHTRTFFKISYYHHTHLVRTLVGIENRGFSLRKFFNPLWLPAKMSTFSPLGRKFCINGVWIIMTYFSPST